MDNAIEYGEAFRHLKMTRIDGVLEVALHSDGGPVIFNLDTYRDLYAAFTAIGADRDNRVVILTGTGDAFVAGADLGDPKVSGTPQGFNEYYWHCQRMQQRFLEIEAFVVAALNGPVRLHTELPLLCDTVIATPNTYFQDAGHIPGRIVPGDGAHVIWEELLGPVGAKHFLLSSRRMPAEEAKAVYAINEIVEPNQLLPRAHEIAVEWAKLPTLTIRYSRLALNHRLRRRFLEGVPLGMALEGITVFDTMNPTKPA